MRRAHLTVACVLATLASACTAQAQIDLPDGPVDQVLKDPVKPVRDALPGPLREVIPELPSAPSVRSPGAESPGSGGGASSPSGGGSGGGAGAVGDPARAGSDGRPGSDGGGRAGEGGRTPASRAARREERAARAAARRDGRLRPGTLGEPPRALAINEPGFTASAIRDLTRAIPAPVWWTIGVLAYLVLIFGAYSFLTGNRARRLERQRQQLLQDVGLLQAALLPEVPGQLSDLRVSVAYKPAEGLAAGGDFYDAFAIGEGRVGFVVGDVAGHGREALVRTNILHYSLRAYLEAGVEPRMALQLVGRNVHGIDDGKFTTVVVGSYDCERGMLTYATAGHPPPLVIGPAPHEPITAFSAPPVGVGLKTGIRQTRVPVPPGSIACFFTDGLVEARADGDLLGREGVEQLVVGLGTGVTAQGLIDGLIERAERVTDDMAVCIVERGEGQAPADTRIEELELDADGIDRDSLERFLAGCRVASDAAAAAIDAIEAEAKAHGGAMLRVEIDAAGTRLDVLPRNVESLPLLAATSAHA